MCWRGRLPVLGCCAASPIAGKFSREVALGVSCCCGFDVLFPHIKVAARADLLGSAWVGKGESVSNHPLVLGGSLNIDDFLSYHTTFVQAWWGW